MKLKDKTRRLKKALIQFCWLEKRLEAFSVLGLNIFEWVWTIYIKLSLWHLLHLRLRHWAHHVWLMAQSNFLTCELWMESILGRHNSTAHLALRKRVSHHLPWSSSVHCTGWRILVLLHTLQGANWLLESWVSGHLNDTRICWHHVLVGMHTCVYLVIIYNLKINYTIFATYL